MGTFYLKIVEFFSWLWGLVQRQEALLEPPEDPNDGARGLVKELRDRVLHMNERVSALVAKIGQIKCQLNLFNQRSSTPTRVVCRFCQGDHWNKNCPTIVCGYYRKHGHLEECCWKCTRDTQPRLDPCRL
ncbi:hypothetical protein O6H91_Y575400 [Diphasiastrum complanatum]|nr:hypothetical protein O6H91_Y575400 [Diphasiastrum complanatum]